MVASLRQGRKEDGYEVSISKLCQGFGVARRSVYYQPTKAPRTVKPELAAVRGSWHYPRSQRHPMFAGPRTCAGSRVGGMVERVIPTIKEQCAHRHRFETLQHASRVIGDRIEFYDHRPAPGA